MEILDFESFFRQLEIGECIDETCFYFVNDSQQKEYFLGCISTHDKPYWVGLCDIPNGMEFATADELVNAPIYNGCSLKERWNEVRIISIEGVSLEDWLELFVKNGVRRTLKE